MMLKQQQINLNQNGKSILNISSIARIDTEYLQKESLQKQFSNNLDYTASTGLNHYPCIDH